jgi:sulfofructose kinase
MKVSTMPNPTKSKLLCVGALTMDTIFRLDRLPPGPGKFIPLEAVEIAAGMASSAAATIARLGGDVSLWASTGQDDIGRRVIADLTAEGVDCSHVRRIDGARSAFSSIFVDAAGERMIVPFYDTALLSAPEVMPPIAEGAFDVVMTDVRWPLAAAQALKAARSADVHGVLDADTASLETLEMLLPLASHIVASEPAAELVTGETDPERATVALAALYGRDGAFIAVTGGGRGCFWYDELEGEVRHMPIFPVNVVDTLAAGDVFHGAFALGLARGYPIYQIMRFASAAAAIKCSRFGGRRGAPTKSDVTAFLAEQSNSDD